MQTVRASEIFWKDAGFIGLLNRVVIDGYYTVGREIYTNGKNLRGQGCKGARVGIVCWRRMLAL